MCVREIEKGVREREGGEREKERERGGKNPLSKIISTPFETLLTVYFQTTTAYNIMCKSKHINETFHL